MPTCNVLDWVVPYSAIFFVGISSLHGSIICFHIGRCLIVASRVGVLVLLYCLLLACLCLGKTWFWVHLYNIRRLVCFFFISCDCQNPIRGKREKKFRLAGQTRRAIPCIVSFLSSVFCSAHLMKCVRMDWSNRNGNCQPSELGMDRMLATAYYNTTNTYLDLSQSSQLT